MSRLTNAARSTALTCRRGRAARACAVDRATRLARAVAGGLALVASNCLALAPAAAQDSCGQFVWWGKDRMDLFAGHMPTFPSGQWLMREGVFALALQPDLARPDISPVPAAAGSWGGTVILERIAGGSYRIALSDRAKVRISQGRLAPPLHIREADARCPDVRQIVEFTAPYGWLELELSDVRASVVRIAILPIAR